MGPFKVICCMLVVLVLVGACGDDTSVQIDAAAVDSNPTVTEGDHVQGLKQHAQGETDSGALRRSFAIHMRSDKSRPIEDKRQGLTEFLDNSDYCPVIYCRS